MCGGRKIPRTKLTEELVRVGKYLDTKATALFILYYLDIKNGGRHFINCIIKEVPRNDYFIWVSNVMSCDLSGVGRSGSALVMMCDPG